MKTPVASAPGASPGPATISRRPVRPAGYPVRRMYAGCTWVVRAGIGGKSGSCTSPNRTLDTPPGRAPFVYRLGLQIFNLARRVRLP